jgi:predicted acetyltransferase
VGYDVSPLKRAKLKFLETNSPSVAHVGYDISPLSRAKFKILTTRLTSCG